MYGVNVFLGGIKRFLSPVNPAPALKAHAVGMRILQKILASGHTGMPWCKSR
jgi:hypothetical protein